MKQEGVHSDPGSAQTAHDFAGTRATSDTKVKENVVDEPGYIQDLRLTLRRGQYRIWTREE